MPLHLSTIFRRNGNLWLSVEVGLIPVLFLINFIFNTLCFLKLHLLPCSRSSFLLLFFSLKITHILKHRPSMFPFLWPLCQECFKVEEPMSLQEAVVLGWYWTVWDDCYTFSLSSHQDFKHGKCNLMGLLEFVCLNTFTWRGKVPVSFCRSGSKSLWMSLL